MAHHVLEVRRVRVPTDEVPEDGLPGNERMPWNRVRSPAEDASITFSVEIEREDDGRWLAEVLELPGTLVYGASSSEALARAKALALRVVADRLEHGEAGPDLSGIDFAAA